VSKGKATKKPATKKRAPKKTGVRKADVIAKVERESARLVRIVREMGERRASEPLIDRWSAQDVVAHCVYWQGMLARMMGVRTLPLPSWIPRLQAESEIGTDELNRLTVDHYRTYPLEAVLADFIFTAELVRRVVDEMKEENLMLPAGEPWGSKTPVHEAIAGETHAHWKEHADQLEAAPQRSGGRS